MSESSVLTDDFIYTLNNDDIDVRVTLSRDTLAVCDGRSSNAYRIKSIHVADIIGAKVHYGTKDAVYLLVHYFPLVKNRFNGKIRRCKKQVIFCANQHDTTSGNVMQCITWKKAISRIVNGSAETKEDGSQKPTKRSYLVFVNPKGGKGFAKNIWLNTVKPMFDVAGIVSEVVYTEYSGHAGDYIKDCEELYKYTAIVTVSGDGIIFEVFNGLMKREDCEEAIKVPLAIIPGGSGNGLCAAILHQSDVPLTLMDAVFVAIRGIVTPLDLVKVEQGDNVMWSFLSIAWGLLSAVDIESEKMRWMGEARFTVEAVKKLLSFPIRSGKVWFAPFSALSPNEDRDSPGISKKVPKFRKKHLSEPIKTESTASESAPSPTPRPRLEREVSSEVLDPDIDFTALNDNSSDSEENSQDLNAVIPDRTRIISEQLDQVDQSAPCGCKKCIRCPTPDPVMLRQVSDSIERIGLNDTIPDSWTLLEGKFATVNAFCLSHLTMSIPNTEGHPGMDSGFMWFMWSDSDSYVRKDFLQLLVQNCTPESNETRTIHFEKVRAFRLEPEVSESGAYVTIDGELVPYEALHACIYKGKARVMCLPD